MPKWQTSSKIFYVVFKLEFLPVFWVRHLLYWNDVFTRAPRLDSWDKIETAQLHKDSSYQQNLFARSKRWNFVILLNMLQSDEFDKKETFIFIFLKRTSTLILWRFMVFKFTTHIRPASGRANECTLKNSNKFCILVLPFTYFLFPGRFMDLQLHFLAEWYAREAWTLWHLSVKLRTPRRRNEKLLIYLCKWKGE